VPNPHYWRGAPKLKELIWKVVPDTNTLMSQLQAHEIDVYRGVDENQISRLDQVTGIRVLHRTLANWRHLGVNCSRPFLSDARVRQAIAGGVDWKRLVETIYHGYDQLAVSDIFPESWAAPTLPAYKYDPAHARALLAAAGWHPGPDGILQKNGQRLSLTLVASTVAKTNDQAEAVIQSMLRNLGIDVAIRNYPPSYLFAQNGPLYTGKYDLEYSIDTNGPDPDNSGNWNSAFIPPHGANTSWLRDKIVDETSQEAAESFDQAKRKALYQREEERIRQLAPAVFIYWETSYYAVNSDVRNFVPAAYLVDFWNAWQWQI
jgi:peptide/nickel transport system substrate-binding protein